VFTALPENYTTTDFDIHINDSSEMTKDVETIKQFTQEMIKGGLIDAETAVDSLDAKSISECKRNISKGIKKQEEKNGMIQQLQ
jgi:ribosomal protein L7/L12